jgi:cyclic-di-GMP phosphodiesterase TipF (flagellum assembly factor)
MQRLTLPLLLGTYFIASLILGFLLWRGGGWAAGAAGFVGGMAAALAVHNMVARALDAAEIGEEIEAIRAAQRILLEQIEKVDERLAEVADTVTTKAVRKSEELAGEVQMLEDLVHRLSTRITDSILPPAAGRLAPQQQAQSQALLQTVRDALTEGRVDLYLQPVVGLPQRKRMYYESYSRLRDETGRVMMPAEYLKVAEPEGLITSIDNLLLFRCVQIVRRLAKEDRKVGIFCNVSQASLSDESFFPQFLDLLSTNRDLAGALIFELGQDAFKARGSIEARNMAKLADLGFRFSIDKVTDLDLDFQDLARADVKFVKVGAQLLLEQLVEREGRLVLRALPDLAAEDFAGLLRRYGVELIAEKIETERQVVDILELDIGLGQGHLFGEPRPIRDQVLAETAPPPAYVRTTLARRQVAGSRF